MQWVKASNWPLGYWKLMYDEWVPRIVQSNCAQVSILKLSSPKSLLKLKHHKHTLCASAADLYTLMWKSCCSAWKHRYKKVRAAVHKCLLGTFTAAGAKICCFGLHQSPQTLDCAYFAVFSFRPCLCLVNAHFFTYLAEVFLKFYNKLKSFQEASTIGEVPLLDNKIPSFNLSQFKVKHGYFLIKSAF